MKRLLLIALVLFLACEDKQEEDCAGVPNGNSEILTYWYDADSDGLGAGEPSQFCNASVEEGWILNNNDEDDNCTSNVHDCANVCDGGALEDNCDDCVGGNTGVDACVQDCAGVWGGDAVLDVCGICNGDNSTCQLNFLLEDLNPSSETYGINIGPQFFEGKVTLYYFPFSES